MRWLAQMVLAAGLLGCATAQVKPVAAETLNCPEGDLTLEEKSEGTWWVTGCGRGAVCEKPDVADAEVTCAGGGPLR